MPMRASSWLLLPEADWVLISDTTALPVEPTPDAWLIYGDGIYVGTLRKELAQAERILEVLCILLG
ncbi:hypothetical protein DIE15_02910 [Burkholderia sp. Bp9031]|nr:hypothetical protein DIE15_02910 [Burkholderia sp. Bp9031]